MSGNQMILLGGSQAPAVDPYFYSVTSLLHGDGTNGGQNNTFLDSSTNNFTITRNGNTTQGSFSPFSQTGWSNYFDGSGDYLSIPSNSAFSFGTGDFTVEAWVNYNSVASNGVRILATAGAAADFLVTIDNSNRLEFFFAGSGYTCTGGTTTANAWNHLAVVRSGSTIKGYINGVEVGSTTNSGNITNSQAINFPATTNYAAAACYISNLRYVKGTAVYTSAFTPPTTPLTAISGTSLLTCQSNRFIDNSSNAFAITVNGDTSVQPFSPFNPITPYSTSAVGGSGYFDGSGDYLSLADNAAFDIGSGNFTFEFWMYTSVTGSDMYIFGQSNSSGSTSTVSYYIYKTSGNKLTLGITNGINLYAATSTNNLPVNAWVHIACVRDGNTLRNYINGVQDGTADVTGITAVNSSTQLAIGRLGEYNASLYSGYLSNFRMVVGTCVYTGGTTFTPPTAPLPAIANTQLLTNFTNGAIFDNAAVADYETVGNAQISTSVKKYGTGSIAFDGTGDYLLPASNQNFAFRTGDFTVEYWIYTNSSADDGIFQLSTTAGGFATSYTNGMMMAVVSGVLYYALGGSSVSTGLTINNSTWYHIAMCRTSGVLKIYVNGTPVISTANTTDVTATNLVIGGYYSSSYTLVGYIDDFRISRVSRYPYGFTPPTAEFPNIGGTVTLTADPYYDYTTLLLPGNGTNGAQNNTFLDGSTNNFTITRNGNTTQGTFSPFSQTGWGNYFDGSGDYLSVADNAAFNFGSGDFCIEAFIYPTQYNTTDGYGIVTCKYAGGGASNQPWSVGVQSSGIIRFIINGSVGLDTVATVPLNQWSHVAVSRSGTSLVIWINGTSAASATNSTSFNAPSVNPAVGSLGATGLGYFYGYISNVRIVKGTAVYTTDFTPPTAPLTAITNTSLLTCQSNRFIDNSTNALTITPNGGVSVQAFSPFNPTAAWSAATNGGSGYFDGSGDYLTTTGTSSFNGSTGNWTFEAWCYFNNASNNDVLINGIGAGGDRFYILWVASTFYLGDGVQNTIVAGSGKPINQWFHIAVVKNGSTYTAYLNGASIGTSTTALANTAITTFEIGGRTSQSWFTSGYIANFRYSQSAVYTTTFTPPTSPVTGGALLLNFTNAGIYDATSKNDLETVGNAQISTTQSKFGGSSMYFDGTDDSLRFYEIINTQFGTGDFTVECWVYISSLASNQVICDARGSTVGTQPWQFYVNTSGKVVFNYGSNLVGGISVSTATWTHIAAARYGSTLRIFVNGVFDSSATTSASLNGVSGQPAYIGRVYDSPGSPYFNGYIDDLRITKGIARYTSNFTPPTTAFLTL